MKTMALTCLKRIMWPEYSIHSALYRMSRGTHWRTLLWAVMFALTADVGTTLSVFVALWRSAGRRAFWMGRS